MPVTHSNFNGLQVQNICNLAILPLKTKTKGPAPPQSEGEDIIDEALTAFKANVFFKNFEVKGNADRLLVYVTLYISQALLKMPNLKKGDAEKQLFALAIENFALPGDKNFALGGIVTNPANRGETDTIRQYLTQIRQETGQRLLQKVYANGDAAPDKWWMCFNKRKFLNKNL
ncbi:hypothetical protein PROFUN_06676 [Planoprotostelium fungivorum]|uniref:Actin-related protein 2/3 complex subunit 3 n=1 Tax=Planoprotostelium fungivorum TaxID=1890364 RepID=A0A2P6NG12_9EUKA|nr:hypothetical protein PROFUN_06676 [Planoprotostelium fungivorum]